MPVMKAFRLYKYTVFVPTFQAELLFTIPSERVESVVLSAMLKSILFSYIYIPKIKATCRIEKSVLFMFFTLWNFMLVKVFFLIHGEISKGKLKSFSQREKEKV